jgi:hypothetical protein
VADRLRQVLLEAFSNTGRPRRRIDRANVMIGIFAREGSVVEWRAWNWTGSKHRRHRLGVRGALAVEHIHELGESPPTREARTPVAVTFGLPTVNQIRGSLLPGAVCSPIPERDDQHFPFRSSKSSPALRATHQGGVQAQGDRWSAVLPVQEPDAHGFGGSYRPSEIPCR